MLVIRRRPGEAIRIGENVEIEIIECGPNRVKLGIRAPKQIPVWRAETKLARDQNIAAATWHDLRALRTFTARPAPSGEAAVSGLLERPHL